MNSYNQALSAYAQSAGDINENLAAYRSDVDKVKGVNKQLREAAGMKVDMDALRGLGEEMGVRAFKMAVGKYGGKLYEYKFGGEGGTSIGDLDRQGTDRITRGIRRGVNRLRGRDTEGDVEESGEGVELQDVEGGTDVDTGSIRVNRMGSRGQSETTENTNEGDGDMTDNLEDEAGVDEPAETEQSFSDFMDQFNAPTTESGDIDFERADNQMGMGQEDIQSRRLSSQANREAAERDQMGTQDQDVGEEKTSEDVEETKEQDPEDTDGARDFGDEGGAEDLADDARNALQDTAEDGADALSGLASSAATEGADTAVAGGLEAAGAGLDATGVGAIIGVPLQIAGAILEGGALYEAGKSIWDWFDDDILGNKPKVPSIATPMRMPTLAQRGMLITPNMDTLDQQTSYGSF